MTEKELSQYFKLKREVDDLEQRIKEFGDGVKAIQPHEIVVSGSKEYLSIQEKIMMLKSQYYHKLCSSLEEYDKISKYINNVVDDPEIRTLMRYRFLDLNTWEQIAEKTYQERTTAAKKVRRYLKQNK